MKQMLMEWVLTSALLILTVTTLRALLGRRISAGLRYALWAVVLLRLLVPLQFFSLPVPAALPEADREPITATAAPAVSFPAIQGEPVGAPVITAPHPGGAAANHDVTDTLSAAILDAAPLWDVLGWLWLAGAVIMTTAFLFSNLTFALRLRRVRVPLEGADCTLPVYLAENLPSPCLFGLVRPSVYVTAESTRDPAMLRHVLTHEYTHFRHRDYVWNLLRSVALAVHWWNPLVWLAVILNRRDCELACDEGALKRLGAGERIAYGRTLLALITVKPRPGDLLRCATTMTGGQKNVFDRVTRIARAPKRWLWAAVVVVIATALACVCAFGQAADPEPADTPDLTSDLTFSLGEEGTSVRIEGSVDGIKLERPLWFAPSWFNPFGEPLMYPLGQLIFEMPLCDETVCLLDACWTDESRTVVKVTAAPMAIISSYSEPGNLIVTVDLSKGGGTLLELDGYIPKLSPSAPELVPTEAEAVRTARVAAKLLTGAEDYYQSHSEDLSPQPVPELSHVPDVFADVLQGKSKFVLYQNEPPISIDEIPAIIDPYDSYMCLQRYAVVDLLGDGTPEILAYICGVSGDMAGYLLLWDEDGQVHAEIFDSHGWRNRWFIDLKTDGTFECTDAPGVGWESISRLSFTAADGWTLYSEAVHRASESPYNDGNGFSLESLESLMVVERDCSDEEFQEALEGQRAKPDATWYELPLKGFDGGPTPTQPTISIEQ